MLDTKYMERALALAERGRGYTNPNPLVGCVVVKEGQIIGEGWHQRYGDYHAERNALSGLTPEETVGSTVYVTLEPCCHQGKQPPCSDLIIRHRPARVVIGSLDPNPLVAGGGVDKLRKAGISVTIGVAQLHCEEQNIFFRHFMKTRRPYVAQKYAMTLDGKIAAADGDSKWVTGEESRRHVQELRRRYAGILVGIGTVLADDPLLTCRIDPAAHPTRIICDNHLRLPLDSQIVNTAVEVPTVVVCLPAAKQTKHDKWQQLVAQGIEFIEIVAEQSYWSTLLDALGERGIDSLLIEGGGKIHGSCLTAQIADYIYAYVAPKLIGGAAAASPIEGAGLQPMRQAVRLDDVILTELGVDYLFAGRPNFSAAQAENGDRLPSSRTDRL
ncbi:MAG TPA: bifunctional diaminohydroxyphosphoribosylaminopyrimidine deaminase/5-amino-6-(5-phosphoribosylamino)uracil reductase RibD [Clostridiaceae bacterium]|nr:bifunctional diaminohydroxyphosphoribosylaminopyrimidine deaminase/5-amino-6-(5-phosphoribosylamino)uracil reductase RibD [Clostridiaceae bacterium]